MENLDDINQETSGEVRDIILDYIRGSSGGETLTLHTTAEGNENGGDEGENGQQLSLWVGRYLRYLKRMRVVLIPALWCHFERGDTAALCEKLCVMTVPIWKPAPGLPRPRGAL